MSPNSASPIEPAQNPSSPFLANFSKRFRTGSVASRASSQSSEAAKSVVEVAVPANDAQSTKKYLQSLIRDDWDYPDVNPSQNANKPTREATSWRHRDDSVSEYESEGEKAESDDKVYKFDSPDDVGTEISRRRARRKRLLDQEMTWNEGLRTWTLRRDAWVGARSTKPEPPAAEVMQATSREDRLSHSSAERNSLSSGALSIFSKHTNDEDMTSLGGNKSNVVHGSLPHEGPFLPIYPPLLPSSHALRSRIMPSAYATIYSKVVIQGLAPNVPIPLSHMINALVQGWKAEGNWPPQGTVQAQAMPRKKGKTGESAFRRWKREQEEKKQAAIRQEKEIRQHQEGSHKGVRQSISGVVKKAFGKGSNPEELGEHDLEKMGLTFQANEDTCSEAERALQTTKL